MNTTLVCLSLIAGLVLCIVKFLSRNYEVFKNRGVEFEKPKLFFGNMLHVFLGRETEAALIENFYERFSREKYEDNYVNFPRVQLNSTQFQIIWCFRSAPAGVCHKRC